jgi:hypothetical protein
VIEDGTVWVGKGEEAEFKGRIVIPRKGVLQIVVNGAVAIEMPYRLQDDKLTLTIERQRSRIQAAAQEVPGLNAYWPAP